MIWIALPFATRFPRFTRSVVGSSALVVSAPLPLHVLESSVEEIDRKGFDRRGGYIGNGARCIENDRALAGTHGAAETTEEWTRDFAAMGELEVVADGVDFG